jgi:hypothetical protein
MFTVVLSGSIPAVNLDEIDYATRDWHARSSTLQHPCLRLCRSLVSTYGNTYTKKTASRHDVDDHCDI